MVLIVKVHQSENGIILVVSDKEVVGKRFEEGDLQLDLTKEFYAGEEKGKEEVLRLFKSAWVIHLTGEGAVALGEEEGLVEGGRVLVVSGVPHAEVCFGG